MSHSAKSAELVLARKTSRCPQCQASGPRTTGETWTCDTCQFIGSPLEFSQFWNHRPPTGRQGHPPPHTRIVQRHLADGATIFELPPRKTNNWLLALAVLGTGFVFLATSFGAVEVSDETDSGLGWVEIFPILMAVLFRIASLGLLYWCLKMKFGRQLVSIRGETLTYVDRLFRRRKFTSFSFSEAPSITSGIAYTKNHKPVYAIEIQGKGKKIRFGSSLSHQEKGWLIAELKALAVSSKPQDIGGGTKIEQSVDASKSPFEIILPAIPVRVRDHLAYGALLAIPLGLIVLALSPLMAGHETLRMKWLVTNCCFGFVLIASYWFRIRNSKRDLQLLSDGSRLNLNTRANGREIKRCVVSTAEILRVAHYNVGTSNGQSRFGASLITAEKNLILFRWRGDSASEEFIKELGDRIKASC